MRNLATIVTAALIAVGLAGTAIAKPPTVLLTGGGTVQNNDSGLGILTSVGGFNAKATGVGEAGSNGGTVWTNAKGQIQAKLVDATDPTRNVSTLHGKVVCIALLSGGVFVAGDYEVRFVVTRSSGEFPVPVGAYGSLFVNDSGPPSAGGTDMADENFDPLEFDNSDCDSVDPGRGAHEPVVAGNFTVH